MQMPLRRGRRGGKPRRKRFKVCFIQAEPLQPQCPRLCPHAVKPPSRFFQTFSDLLNVSLFSLGDLGPSLTEKAEASHHESQDLLPALKPMSPTLSPAPVPGTMLATSPVGPGHLPCSGAWLPCGLLFQSPPSLPLLWLLPRHPGTS